MKHHGTSRNIMRHHVDMFNLLKLDAYLASSTLMGVDPVQAARFAVEIVARHGIWGQDGRGSRCAAQSVKQWILSRNVDTPPSHFTYVSVIKWNFHC
jgi:hypothetical protein